MTAATPDPRADGLADLARWQREFTAALRAPLARTTGHLTATPATYPRPLVARLGGDRGLAAYQLQYWCRLFDALQVEHRLTCALIGAWSFNQLAERFLLAHPPRGHDLTRAADGFATHLATTLDGDVTPPGAAAVPRAAIVEAVTIDDAFRRALAAPPSPPTPLPLERLAAQRLVRAASAAVVTERWPLVALRRDLAGPVEAAVPLPPPHGPGPRTWVVAATVDGPRVAPLSPLAARLVALLAAHPVGEALARLEAERTGDPPLALARAVHAALARTVELGVWAGAAP